MMRNWSGLGLAIVLAGIPQGAAAQGVIPRAVYTLSNGVDGNRVVLYERSVVGTLRARGSVATGGTGTGSGLGNQGALAIRHDDRWLFAVNPGSDDISSLQITTSGLRLVDVVASGGRRPVSLTVDRDLLYVLNAGGQAGATDNIAGFRVREDGRLTMIPGSQQPLSADSTGPAQISFSPDGRMLVVTEKATNRIVLYPVDGDGLAGAPVVQDSMRPTPFGFAFGKRNQLFISEAAGGAADASAVSSYHLAPDGGMLADGDSEPTTETAACWVVLTPDGRRAYTTNTGSNTITGFLVAFGGGLRRIGRDGVTASTGRNSSPIDLAMTEDGRFLYSLNSGNQTISMFEVEVSGRLRPMGQMRGVPAGATGLIAR